MGEKQPIYNGGGGDGFGFNLLKIWSLKTGSISIIDVHLKDDLHDKRVWYFALIFPFYFTSEKFRFDSSLEDLPRSGPHPPASAQVLNMGGHVATLSKVAAPYSR